MSAKPKLIPVDRKQCQAEKPNPDYGPFRMGGSNKLRIRCTSKPKWIATEPTTRYIDWRGISIRPAGGSMALCDSCKAVCERDVPKARIRRIRRKAA